MTDGMEELEQLASSLEFDWRLLRVDFDEEGCVIRYRDPDEEGKRFDQAHIIGIQWGAHVEVSEALIVATHGLNELITAALKINRAPDDVVRRRL